MESIFRIGKKSIDLCIRGIRDIYMIMALIDGRKHNASHVLTGYTYTRSGVGGEGRGGG